MEPRKRTFNKKKQLNVKTLAKIFALCADNIDRIPIKRATKPFHKENSPNAIILTIGDLIANLSGRVIVPTFIYFSSLL